MNLIAVNDIAESINKLTVRSLDAGALNLKVFGGRISSVMCTDGVVYEVKTRKRVMVKLAKRPLKNCKTILPPYAMLFTENKRLKLRLNESCRKVDREVVAVFSETECFVAQGTEYDLSENNILAHIAEIERSTAFAVDQN